jgi:hypothetical protein
MKIQHICVFIPFLCFLGCASNDKETNLTPAMRAILVQDAVSHFPLPATTPYDADSSRREQYLQGYKNGVRERLRRMGEKEWSIAIPPPTNENERPFFDGYKDGIRAKPD